MGYMMMRDLRACDNWALQAAQHAASKRSLPLVVFYPYSFDWLDAHGISPWQLSYMIHVLELLRLELDLKGISLQFIDIKLRMANGVAHFCRDNGIHHLYTTAEYEVDEKQLVRDLSEVLNVHAIHQSCVVEPGTLTTLKGTQYAVFTPWFRSWCAHVNAHPETLDSEPKTLEEESPTESAESGLKKEHKASSNSKNGDKLEAENDEQPKSKKTKVKSENEEGDTVGGNEASDSNPYNVISEIENPLSLSSSQRTYFDRHYKIKSLDQPLQNFEDNIEKVLDYNNRRNDLTSSTSRMSHHLALGVISPRQLIRLHLDRNDIKKVDSGKADVVDYVRELAWRDFYRHILSCSPHVSKHLPYQLKYKSADWETSDIAASHFDAWCNGQTGFPIVDALMRQLLATGYLDNRSRMIVASFLSKNLLVDWRLGEQWFATHLIDYDFLSNNGGWGFCASVGVDPQPYFRVFNPYLQSTKFDKRADFIRKWVPELKDMDPKLAHLPHDTREGSRIAAREKYPKPIVDYKKTRERAIETYKAM